MEFFPLVVKVDPLEMSGDYAEVRNATKARLELSEAQTAHARETFEPVYAFCRAMFGERLPSAWRS